MEVKVGFGLRPNVASETSHVRVRLYELSLYKLTDSRALNIAAGSEQPAITKGSRTVPAHVGLSSY